MQIAGREDQNKGSIFIIRWVLLVLLVLHQKEAQGQGIAKLFHAWKL